MQPTSAKSDLNLPLKLAVVASRERQSVIAQCARINEVRFSKIVTGRIRPTPQEQRRIARALQRYRARIVAALQRAQSEVLTQGASA